MADQIAVKFIILTLLLASALGSTGFTTFSYGVSDPNTGDFKDQYEKREGDNVVGKYSLIDADGTKRIVVYSANDATGFQAIVHKERVGVAPGLGGAFGRDGLRHGILSAGNFGTPGDLERADLINNPASVTTATALPHGNPDTSFSGPLTHNTHNGLLFPNAPENLPVPQGHFVYGYGAPLPNGPNMNIAGSFARRPLPAVSHYSHTIFHDVRPNKGPYAVAPGNANQFSRYGEQTPLVHADANRYETPVDVHRYGTPTHVQDYAPTNAHAQHYGVASDGHRYGAPSVANHYGAPTNAHRHVPSAEAHHFGARADAHHHEVPADIYHHEAPIETHRHAAPADVHRYETAADAHHHEAPTDAHLHGVPAETHRQGAPANAQHYGPPDLGGLTPSQVHNPFVTTSPQQSLISHGLFGLPANHRLAIPQSYGSLASHFSQPVWSSAPHANGILPPFFAQQSPSPLAHAPLGSQIPFGGQPSSVPYSGISYPLAHRRLFPLSYSVPSSSGNDGLPAPLPQGGLDNSLKQSGYKPPLDQAASGQRGSQTPFFNGPLGHGALPNSPVADSPASQGVNAPERPKSSADHGTHEASSAGQENLKPSNVGSSAW